MTVIYHYLCWIKSRLLSWHKGHLWPGLSHLSGSSPTITCYHPSQEINLLFSEYIIPFCMMVPLLLCLPCFKLPPTRRSNLYSKSLLWGLLQTPHHPPDGARSIPGCSNSPWVICLSKHSLHSTTVACLLDWRLHSTELPKPGTGTHSSG